MPKVLNSSIYYLLSIISFTLNSQTLVKDIELGSVSSNPHSFYPFKNKLIFCAGANLSNRQLYITDGSNSGTLKLTNLFSGIYENDFTNTLNFRGNGAFSDIDSLGFFFAVSSLTNNINTYTTNIYKTDGTINGTTKITDWMDSLDYNGSRFFKWDNKICAFFVKKNSNTNVPYYLFSYDAITKNYTVNQNINFTKVIGVAHSDIGPTPYVFNGKLFILHTFSLGLKDSLYSMDFQGNLTFKAIIPSSMNFLIVNDKLIFSPFASPDPVYGREPFYFDFSNNTSGLLKDINPGVNSSNPELISYSYFHPSQMKIGYFTATDPINGTEIYSTDGTPAGTKITRNIGTGPASFSVVQLGHWYYYKGDSIIVPGQDSIRFLYKDSYYSAFKSASQPGGILDYLSLNSGLYFVPHFIYKFYSLNNYNALDSMNKYECFMPPSNMYKNYSFLKTDSCFYTEWENCEANNLTGKEVFKFCKKDMYFVGIKDEIQEKNNTIIYPNPVNDVLNIQFDQNFKPTTYSIINQLGQIVSEGNITHIKTTLYLNYLPASVYYIKINSLEKTVFKIIKY